MCHSSVQDVSGEQIYWPQADQSIKTVEGPSVTANLPATKPGRISQLETARSDVEFPSILSSAMDSETRTTSDAGVLAAYNGSGKLEQAFKELVEVNGLLHSSSLPWQHLHWLPWKTLHYNTQLLVSSWLVHDLGESKACDLADTDTSGIKSATCSDFLAAYAHCGQPYGMSAVLRG